MLPRDREQLQVILANGFLVLFPIASAHIVREYGAAESAVAFLLVLSFINGLGLLDLGMLRSVLLRQESKGGWKDIAALLVVILVASNVVLTSASWATLWIGVIAGIVYFFGGLLRALLERDQLLLREANHRFWTALSIVIAALALVHFGFYVSMFVMLVGKSFVVWWLGGKKILGYLKTNGVPKVNLLVGMSSVAAFVVLLADRVFASRTLPDNVAATYLFYCLVLQRLVGVFGALLPRYLTHQGLSKREFVVPWLFGWGMFLAVLAYASVSETGGLSGLMTWLPVLVGAYFVNVLTVPYFGRNLVARRHLAISIGYLVQLAVLAAVIFAFGASLTTLATGVFARSAVDLFWQRRLTRVERSLLR